MGHVQFRCSIDCSISMLDLSECQYRRQRAWQKMLYSGWKKCQSWDLTVVKYLLVDLVLSGKALSSLDFDRLLLITEDEADVSWLCVHFAPDSAQRPCPRPRSVLGFGHVWKGIWEMLIFKHSETVCRSHPRYVQCSQNLGFEGFFFLYPLEVSFLYNSIPTSHLKSK